MQVHLPVYILQECVIEMIWLKHFCERCSHTAYLAVQVYPLLVLQQSDLFDRPVHDEHHLPQEILIAVERSGPIHAALEDGLGSR